MSNRISAFLPYYPPIGSNDFNSELFRKYEFRNPEVKQIEDFPSTKGDLMAHQIIISRMLSSRTPYDGMLLLHEMGTGKTCSAIAILEQIRSEKNGFKQFIYVCSSDSLRENFKSEFKGVCTKGDYTDINLSSLKIFTMTYNGFVKKFKGNNLLENTVVIIDEVHNIRRISNIFSDIIKSGKNVKTILMSGTPMTDSPSGIAHIMNMILPDDKQLITNEDFYDNIDDSKIQILRRAFRGRISYIKAIPSEGVNKRFIQNDNMIIPIFKHYKTYASVMSEHQYSIYQKALEADFKEGSSAAYSNALQASSFVGDDDKYQQVDLKDFKIKFRAGASVEDKLNELSKYSKKYADSIRLILNNEDKNIFVFNKYIRGGGLIMFAYLLRVFGFTEVTSANVKRMTTSGNNRFILLTGDPTIDKPALINRFNQEDNKNGRHIRVVLASDAISEGYTFKNIQIIDIHSPWFQFAKISQAIARGIRFGSHRALLDADNVSKVDVDIYLRVSVPPIRVKDVSSELKQYGVDAHTYKTAEDKDIIVKRIEHIIKEESIDSLVNYERNKRPKELDNTRDCDYMTCDYKSFPSEYIDMSKDVDYSNFQLYYSDQVDMIDDIRKIFEDKLSIDLTEILRIIDRPKLLILSALYNIIHSNIQIRDGLYLREQNDIYFLSINYSNNSTLYDIYYVRNKFEELLQEEEEVSIDSVIAEILSDESIDSKLKLVGKLVQMNVDKDGRERLLEKVIKDYKIPGKTSVQSDQVLDYFSDLFGQIKGIWYSWYFISTKDKLCRKLDGDWVDCTTDEENDIIIPHLRSKVADVVKRAKELAGEKTGDIYYGMYDYTEDKLQPNKFDKFFIMGLNPKNSDPNDKRKESRGQDCMTYLNNITKYEDIKDKIGIPRDKYDALFAKPTPGKLPKKADGCKLIRETMEGKELIIRRIVINRE